MTTFADVKNNVPKTPAGIAAAGLWFAWGTPHPDFSACKLIKQDISGQEGEFRKPCEEPPKLVRVYEELPANDQIQVGNPDISYDQYGNKTVSINWLQLSAGTSTYTYAVGTTAAPSPNQACLLKTTEATDDGTLIRTKRTFIDGGILSDTETLKFSGRLLLREITQLGGMPATPAGYTLVTTSIEFFNGRRVIRAGFANGSTGAGAGGTISDETTYRQSPDTGTTGVTVRTIQAISASSVGSNPIPPPSGYTLIEVKYADEDGYRLWTATYAFGQGTISSDVQTKENRKLIVYNITALNAIPATPAATIGGTVTLIKAEKRNGTESTNGTIIYDYQWAEGIGEVSRDIDYSQSSDQGATGVTKTTIKYLVAPAATVQPTALAGSVEVQRGYTEADGYRLWTTVWAKGTGEVARKFTNAQGGATDFDPAAPTANTGPVRCVITYLTATTVETDPTTRPTSFIRLNIDHEERDGYRVWVVTFGYGRGTVDNTTETKEGGKLIVYRQTELNPSGSYTPTAPTATIGGAVTLITRTKETSEGCFIYRSAWAEGFGETSRSTRYEQDSVGDGSVGVTIIEITHLTALGASDPTSAPSGTVKVASVPAARDGYLVWRVTYAKGTGLVVTTNDLKIPGKLVLYRRVALGSAPSAPSATISGTVTATGTGYREADGYRIYDYTWIEAVGTTDNTVQAREDGSLVYHVTTVTATATTPADPGTGTGYLVDLIQTDEGGYFRNRATYIKAPADYTVPVQVQFHKPGLVIAANPPAIVPPVTLDLMGTNTVTFSTSQTASTPYKISAYCSVIEYFTFVQAGQALTYSRVQEQPGYLGSSTLTLIITTYRGYSTVNGVITVTGSNPTTLPTGTKTLHVRCEKYLTATDGTTVWRNEVVTADVT